MMKHLFRFAILTGMLAVIPAAPLQGGSALSKEYKIKAALIYNFLKFIDWSDEQKAALEGTDASLVSERSKDFVLGIYARDDVYQVFQSLQGKAVKNRRIRLKRLRDRDLMNADLEALAEVDVLYLAGRLDPRKHWELNKVLNALKERSILTIGEVKGFLEMGGIINFLKERNRVHFEINLDAAKRARLQIKTSLLKLASRVLQKK